MNENWLNGKYNLIYVGKEKETLVTGSVPKNVVLHTGKLSDIAFKIRQQELDNDEVFSGNLITTESVSNIDFDTINSPRTITSFMVGNDITFNK